MNAGALPDPALADNARSALRSPTGGPETRSDDSAVAPQSSTSTAERTVLRRPAPGPGPARVLEVERMHGRNARVAARLGVVVIAVWLLALWYGAAPDVPIWDGWTWIGHAQAFAEGGLPALWEEHPLVHTQHVYALPSFLALLLGPLVGYSFRFFAFLTLAGVFATGLVLWSRAHKEGLGPFTALAVFAAVASMRHYENFLCGFQLGLPACVAFGTLAVVVADTRRDRTGLVLAWVLALASAASSSAGLLAPIAVILVREFDLDRPKLVIAGALGLGLVVVVAHFALVALYGHSFVDAFLSTLSWSTAPELLEKTARIAGGGLIGGSTALPLGFALLAGALAIVVTRIRRLRRVDALTGLALFSFFACGVIASARGSSEAPAGRYAIFAAPLVGVCAIGFLGWLQRTPSVRAMGYSSVLVGLAWCGLSARVEVEGYNVALRALAFDASYAIALATQGEPLTGLEIARVNNGPTDVIRRRIQYVADKKWCGASHARTIEKHDELPRLVQGATNVRVVDGLLRFSGEGHVYDDYPGAPTMGRAIQLDAEVSCMGLATVGVIFLRADGTERTNIGEPVHVGHEYTRMSMRGLAGPGERIRPYVYANDPKQEVVVKSFRVVLVDTREVP